MTQKYRIMYWITAILSILLNILPITYYSIEALLKGEAFHQKLALSMTLLIVIILSLVAFVNKIALRSRLWILLIGLYICLDHIIAPLIMIACCQVADELIVSPIKKFAYSRLIINKQIDKRLGVIK